VHGPDSQKWQNKYRALWRKVTRHPKHPNQQLRKELLEQDAKEIKRQRLIKTGKPRNGDDISDILMTQGWLRSRFDTDMPTGPSDNPHLADQQRRMIEARSSEGRLVPYDAPGAEYATGTKWQVDATDDTPLGAWKQYTMNSSFINGQALGLRDSPQSRTAVRNLDLLIEQHAEPVKEKVLLRGVKSDSLSDLPEMSLKVGGTLTMPQFGSWTSNGYTARRHAGSPDTFNDTDDNPRTNRRYTAIIRMTDTSKVKGIAGVLGESETILPRNSSFKVTKVQEITGPLEDGTIGVFRLIDVVPA
jgi:hypothetical protein